MASEIGVISVRPGDAVFAKTGVAMRIAKEEIGPGSLFITERAFIWKPDSRPEGITIPWPAVSLHAITNEPRSIYLQLDFLLDWPGVYPKQRVVGAEPPNGEQNNANGQAEPIDEDVDEGNVSDSSDGEGCGTEIHIIPQDDNDINQIYYAMNHCQTLNPDPNDSISEEDEDFMEAEGDDLDENGQGDILRNLNIGDDNEEDEQFADAE